MRPVLDLSFLWSRRALLRIVAITLVFAIGGVAYALLAPEWYRSTLTVMPVKQQKPALSGLLGGDFAAMAGVDGALGGSADVTRIAAVLESVAVTDAVVRKFDLQTRYKAKFIESAREELWRHCDVKPMPKPTLVQLSCEDKDPRFAQQLLTFFAEHGNQVFRRVGVSSASEEVDFLEKRVTELRANAEIAASQMRDFQETHRIVDLDTQSKAVVSTIASLESQRITKQLELDYLRTFSSGDEATLRQLGSQLSVLDGKMNDLQQPSVPDGGSRRGGSGDGRAGGMLPAAMSVPRLRAEFEGLLRDRKVAEATLIFALERLEGAKANAAREVSTFVVLDPPAVPTRKSRPKRLRIVLGFTCAGFALAFVHEWVRSGAGARRVAIAAPERDGESRAA